MNLLNVIDRAEMEQKLVLESGIGKWIGQSHGKICQYSL
jgi:hypothetical protein